MKLPAFNKTKEIEDLAIEIVEILELMEKVGDIDLLFKLRKASRISSIQSSVAIEANTLTLEQVTNIINGKKVAGDAKEIQEVKNAWEAYAAIDDYVPYSLDSFLAAHKKMSSKLVREAGCFRSVQVGVYKGFELIHNGAAPKEIDTLMQQAFEWGQKSNAHPLIKSCVMHFLIEFVHPFEDGNGRMGRLWQTVILANWKPALQWVPVETMVHQNQYGYYQALHDCEVAENAAPFVVFMLNIIAYTLGVIVRSKALPQGKEGAAVMPPSVQDFSDFTDTTAGFTDNDNKLTEKITEIIPEIIPEKLSKGEQEFLSVIMPYLRKHGEINSYRAQMITGKSAESTKKYFAKLVSIGLLQAVGNTKARVYRLAAGLGT